MFKKKTGLIAFFTFIHLSGELPLPILRQHLALFMLLYQLMGIILDPSMLVNHQAFVWGDVAEGPAAAAGGGDPDSAGESAGRAGAL